MNKTKYHVIIDEPYSSAFHSLINGMDNINCVDILHRSTKERIEVFAYHKLKEYELELTSEELSMLLLAVGDIYAFMPVPVYSVSVSKIDWYNFVNTFANKVYIKSPINYVEYSYDNTGISHVTIHLIPEWLEFLKNSAPSAQIVKL